MSTQSTCKSISTIPANDVSQSVSSVFLFSLLFLVRIYLSISPYLSDDYFAEGKKLWTKKTSRFRCLAEEVYSRGAFIEHCNIFLLEQCGQNSNLDHVHDQFQYPFPQLKSSEFEIL